MDHDALIAAAYQNLGIARNGWAP